MSAFRFVRRLVLLVLMVLIVDDRVSAAEPSPPNIVLIMADDLGYGDLGCYGNTINHTPHIDSLAAGGIRFTDFHSNGPMCSPTRAALLTGLYQSRFGRRFESALSGARKDRGLPLEAITIAEVLRDAGYSTACFGKWHLGYEAPYLPTHQGFDVFRGLLSGDGDYHTHIDRSGNKDWWQDDAIAMEEGYTTDLLTEHTVNFIDRHRDRPFFLYLPHLAVHFPWQGPDDPPHRRAGVSYLKDKWGVITDSSNIRPHLKSMIESLDKSVGDVVAAIEQHRIAENTLVIFISDNGGYRDYAGGFKNISDMGPLRGQKGQLYEGGHRVPAIVSWPNKIQASVCRETAMTFDLFPTIAKLAGVDPADFIGPDGVDLRRLLFDSQPLSVSRPLFWRMGTSKAIRQGRYKLCLIGDKAPELYDLDADVGETNNLAASHPKLVARLSELLATWESDVDDSAEAFQ